MIEPAPLPASPPHDVLAQVAAAGERVRELRAQGRALHLEPDFRSGRVRAEVRDLDGRVVGTIGLATMLDVLAGAPLALGRERHGQAY